MFFSGSLESIFGYSKSLSNTNCLVVLSLSSDPITYCDDYDQYVYRVIITVCSTCVFSKDGESLQGSQVELQTIHWFSQSRRMVSIEVIELSIRRRP